MNSYANTYANGLACYMVNRRIVGYKLCSLNKRYSPINVRFDIRIVGYKLCSLNKRYSPINVRFDIRIVGQALLSQ